MVQRISLFAIVWISCFAISQAQSPELMEELNSGDNYFKIEKAIEKYYTPERKNSAAYKQMERWKYFHRRRMKANGQLYSHSALVKQIRQYRQRYGARAANCQNGNWTETGPIDIPNRDNGIGRVSAIVFDRNYVYRIYLGSPSGGIWKSENMGRDWENISNFPARLGVSAVIQPYWAINTLLIGTGDRDRGHVPGLGVWKSTDGGQTWFPSNSGMGEITVNDLIHDFSNQHVIIAAAGNGCFRSTDLGKTWTRTRGPGPVTKDLEYKPGSTDIVYGAGNKFHRSSDGGQTWQKITAGVPTNVNRMSVAVTPLEPEWVYLFAANSNGFEGLYFSDDSGLSFTQMSNSPNINGKQASGGGTFSQSSGDLDMVVHPEDPERIYTAGANIWMSSDRGVTWEIVTHFNGKQGNPKIHVDQHVLTWHPKYPMREGLFAGNDGGIYKTLDEGESWSNLTDGLGIGQAYKIGQSATERDLVLAGFQDCGSDGFDGTLWKKKYGDDGTECAVDYTDPDVQYVSRQNGVIFRTLSGGGFSKIAANGVNGITEKGGWVTPFALHPVDPNIMFAGYTNVWRSTNVKVSSANSVSWTAISSFSGTKKIDEIAISLSNPDVMYIAGPGIGKFYRCDNANAPSPSWTDKSANLPGGTMIKDIEIDPTNPDKVWIAQDQRIYESLNGGDSWTDISGSLPQISLNTIICDKTNGNALYIGMDVGVYYKDPGMPDWEDFSVGLPNVEVTELEITYGSENQPQENSNLLRAGTWGRGVWQSETRCN